MAETIQLRGILKGHHGWVTAIATDERSDSIVSSSRDKTVIQWSITRYDLEDWGHAHKALRGHNHYVEDVVLSKDGQFALSASWDGTLRLWDLNYGQATRRFVGHTKDITSVAFSADNRQIVSGSRDKSIRLWNTLGECKLTIEDAHSDWVSCVAFSPSDKNKVIVSAGWDKLVKVWSLNEEFRCKITLHGHTGYINTVTVSPDGSLCASGGKDGTAMLWDLNEGRHLYSLDAGDIINCLVFSPNRYWLCAGTDSGIKIWDLETKEEVVKAGLHKNHTDFHIQEHTPNPGVTSLAWSVPDGQTLYAGYTDGIIRVWATS